VRRHGSSALLDDDGSRLSAILTPARRRQLNEVLHHRHRGAAWELCFAAHRDGYSAGRLADACAGRRHQILVISCTGGSCFGAYAPDGFGDTGGRFATAFAETFIFGFRRDAAGVEGCERCDVDLANDPTRSIRFVSSKRGLQLGRENPAVFLDADLATGLSGPRSLTFSTLRAPLASSDTFRVADVEVYTMLSTASRRS